MQKSIAKQASLRQKLDFHDGILGGWAVSGEEKHRVRNKLGDTKPPSYKY